MPRHNPRFGSQNVDGEHSFTYEGQEHRSRGSDSRSGAAEIVSTLTSFMSDVGREQFRHQGAALLEGLRHCNADQLSCYISRACSNQDQISQDFRTPERSAPLTPRSNSRRRSLYSDTSSDVRGQRRSPGGAYEYGLAPNNNPIFDQVVTPFQNPRLIPVPITNAFWAPTMSTSSFGPISYEGPQGRSERRDQGQMHLTGLQSPFSDLHHSDENFSQIESSDNTAVWSEQLNFEMEQPARTLQQRAKTRNYTFEQAKPPGKAKLPANITCPENCGQKPFTSRVEFHKHYIGEHEQPHEYICEHRGCNYQNSRAEQFKRHHSWQHNGCGRYPDCSRIEDNPSAHRRDARPCFYEGCPKTHVNIDALLNCWVNHCN